MKSNVILTDVLRDVATFKETLCKTCLFLKTRPKSEQDDWDEVMHSPMATSTAIWRQMRIRGFAGENPRAIAVHRVNHVK